MIVTERTTVVDDRVGHILAGKPDVDTNLLNVTTEPLSQKEVAAEIATSGSLSSGRFDAFVLVAV